MFFTTQVGSSIILIEYFFNLRRNLVELSLREIVSLRIALCVLAHRELCLADIFKNVQKVKVDNI